VKFKNGREDEILKDERAGFEGAMHAVPMPKYCLLFMRIPPLAAYSHFRSKLPVN
jgi:hypothetical protein